MSKLVYTFMKGIDLQTQNEFSIKGSLRKKQKQKQTKKTLYATTTWNPFKIAQKADSDFSSSGPLLYYCATCVTWGTCVSHTF